METNEIKKYLYKEKPTAFFKFIRKGSAYYETINPGKIYLFIIPVSDMGDADYMPEMAAQH